MKAGIKKAAVGKPVSFPTLTDLAGPQEVVGGEVRKSWTWDQEVSAGNNVRFSMFLKFNDYHAEKEKREMI